MAVNRYYSSTAVDTTLASSMTGSATTFTVSSTQGFPTSYPYTLAIDYDTSKEELVNVVGASGTTLTVGTTVGVASTTGRAVDGTQGGTGVSHDSGAVVKHVISGRDMREAQEHIAASTNVHGIADTANLATKTGTETFTNKTLTSPVISSGTLSGTLTNSGTISGGSITGATITSPAISGGSITGTISGNPTFSGTVTLPTGTVTSGMIADGTIVNADVNASAAIVATKLTGTTSEFNTALSDNDFATLAGTETLSNKTITAAGFYSYSPAHTTLTTTATLTAARILTKVIVTTASGGYTLTLDTGTNTNSGILSGALPTDYAIDWCIVNTSGGTITIAGATDHTYTGYTSIPVNTSASFRTRKTASTTFTTYRTA